MSREHVERHGLRKGHIRHRKGIASGRRVLDPTLVSTPPCGTVHLRTGTQAPELLGSEAELSSHLHVETPS